MGRRKTVGTDLPPFVRRKVRSGSTLFYFNAGGGKRDIPMGAKVNMAEYARLMGAHRQAPPSEPEWGLFVQLARAAKARAAKRSVAFDLTPEFLLSLYRTGSGRCAVTGIPFDLTLKRTTRVRPFGVSVDRIECRGPYTRDNVRLICTALNIAINEFGWDVYTEIARRALGKLRKNSQSADNASGAKSESTS